MSDLQCPATLLVCRHGAAEYDTDALTDAGGRLSSLGRRQARELADSVRDRSIAAVYTSPLARAVQSAEVAARALGVGVRVHEALAELTVGAYAGQPAEPNPFAEVFDAWRRGELDVSYPGGASATEVIGRVHGALEHIADQHRGETVLVVSHGGVLSLTLPRLVANLTVGQVRRAPLDNGAFAELAIDADDWRCVAWPSPDDSEEPQTGVVDSA